MNEADDDQGSHPEPFRELLVVIPTRNRAGLALAAARSALVARSAQVRVIFSDNSTKPDEVEKLRAGAAELGIERWHPEHPMSMSDHWEWAIQQARDDPSASHVTFLTDRMVFKPRGLLRLVHILQKMPAQVVSYRHDRADDERTPVSLEEEPWSGRLIRIPTAVSAELVAGADESTNMTLPRLLNCVVPKASLESIESRFGVCCGDSIAPDFAFAFRCLASHSTTLFYDRAVLIHYGLARSNGASTARGMPSEDNVDFVANLGGALRLETPIPDVITVHNVVMHEYLAVRRSQSTWLDIALQPFIRVLAHEVAEMREGPTKAQSQGRLTPYSVVERRKNRSRLRAYIKYAHEPDLLLTRLLFSSRRMGPFWSVATRLLQVTAPQFKRAPELWPTAQAALEHASRELHPPHIGISTFEFSARRKGHGSALRRVATFRR